MNKIIVFDNNKDTVFIIALIFNFGARNGTLRYITDRGVARSRETSVSRASNTEGTLSVSLPTHPSSRFPSQIKNPLKRVNLERETGIEPAYPAWKAGVLAIVLFSH